MLLTKPSKKSIQSITGKIRATVKKAQAWSQDALIKTLKPVIRGWANYHRHIAAKATFKKLDAYLWTVTWQWSKRRYSNKGFKWIANRYWHSESERNWVFKTGENTLLQFSDASIRRHVFPKLDANPYLERSYFIERKDRMRRQTPWIQTKLTYLALPPSNG